MSRYALWFSVRSDSLLYHAQVVLPLGIRALKPSTDASGTAAQEKDADKVEPVDSCTVTFLVNPHTGLTVVSEQKGQLLKDRRDNFWFLVQVAVFVLFLALLFASPWLIEFFRERSVKAMHIKWLKDFYKLHAPEVNPSHLHITPPNLILTVAGETNNLNYA